MSIGVEHPKCIKAVYRQGVIYAHYSDGKEIQFPVSLNQRLRDQPESKLSHIEISHTGLHWPDLDEDLSHAGLRVGRYGQA